MQSKPWFTPFRFMLVIFLFLVLGDIIFFVASRLPMRNIRGEIWFYLIFWPFFVLIETIIYWVMRKKIKERKWVWAHLMFSLFGFVLLKFLTVGLSYLVSTVGYQSQIYNIQFAFHWGSIIIGNIFFIIAIVRSYTNKTSSEPNDENDLLSELAG